MKRTQRWLRVLTKEDYSKFFFSWIDYENIACSCRKPTKKEYMKNEKKNHK